MREIINNKDFRIGLSHAINREEIIDLIYLGRGEPYQVAPRPEDPFYDEEFAKQYTEYDVNLANEHLDRAGYTERDGEGYRLRPDGQRITIAMEATPSMRPEAIDILELIETYWQEVGIDMQIRSQDRSLLWTRKNAAQHDAMVWTGDGGLSPHLNPSRYFPQFDGSHHAVRWAAWYINPESGFAEEPPADVKRQMELYDQVRATADLDRQAVLMRELLEIAKEQFFLIGISLEAPGYGIVKNDFHNVPDVMFDDVLYNNPAATNPEQYFKSQ